MDDDDLEQLVVQMSADYKSFQNDLQKANQTFKEACDKIVAQQADLKKKVDAGFSNLVDGFKRLLEAIGVVEIFKGLVEGSHDLAESTLNTSRAIGVSAENFQGWSILAHRAGVDQDSFTSSLQHFSAAVGDAQLKTTPFGQLMTKLGVDIKNGPEKALLSLTDKIGELPKAQQAAVAQMAFGRGGVQNLSWITDGSKSIQAMVQQFQQLGMVLPQDKLEKINQLFEAWQDIKTEALVGFMNGFASFAGEIETPEFQQGIQTFGQVMGDISGAIVKMAPYLPLLIEAFVTFRAAKGGAMLGGDIGSLFGPEGTALGIGIGGLIGGTAGYLASSHVMNKLTANGPGGETKSQNAPGGSVNLGGVLDEDAAKRAAAQIANLNKTLDQEVTESANKSQDAYGDMVKATLNAATEAARGTAAYYDFLNVQITKTAELDIDKINQRKDADIAAIADRRDAQLASLKTLKLSAQQQADEAKKINDAADQEIVNASATAADQITAINVRKNQQLKSADWQYQQGIQNQIDMTNTLRDGLENVAEAGLHGFKSMKDAAADFLDEIAKTIVKLYVMQPLLNSLFGAPGTSGGGLLGGAITGASSWIADLSLFADGGVMTSRGPLPLRKYASGVANSPQLAMFGEGSDPEAFVPLKDGAIPVRLNLPAIPPVSSRMPAPVIVQQFDLSGAVVTDDILEQARQAGGSAASTQLLQFNKHVLPNRVRQLVSDPYRNY